jgi:hypothetical protein
MAKHVPPPVGEPLAPLSLPPDATPEQLFEAIGRLRKDARDEIDRLIGFLNKTDDYVSRELEDSIDDNPHGDDSDSEPSLGSFDMSNQIRARQTGCHLPDAELDDSDREDDDRQNSASLPAAGTWTSC